MGLFSFLKVINGYANWAIDHMLKLRGPGRLVDESHTVMFSNMWQPCL